MLVGAKAPGAKPPVEAGFSALLTIPAEASDAATLREVLDRLRGWTYGKAAAPTKEEIGRALGEVVPEFAPVATGLSLDARM